MKFLNSDESTSVQQKLLFKNGNCNVTVALDSALTKKNNPRSPQIPSLAVMGILNAVGASQ